MFQKEILRDTATNEGDDFFFRLSSLRGVWNDYHNVFGNNIPLKRCRTVRNGEEYKDWDINFEGVAHYGLLPDLFQDLANVGLEAHDLNPLFHSGEDFARMWTRTLRASAHLKPRFDPEGLGKAVGAGTVSPVPQMRLTFTTGGEDYELEEADNLWDPNGWRPAAVVQSVTNAFQQNVVVPAEGAMRFYRLRKRN